MLDPEAAKEQLKKWQVSQEAGGIWKADRWMPAIKKLPKNPREVGFALLGKDKSGEVYTDFIRPYARYQQLLGEGLEKLTKAERIKLFRTFFGKLASDVELGWQWLKSAPYSAGYYARPFRAGKSPNLTSKRRAAWVQSMIALASGFRDDVLTAPWLAAWVPYIQIGWKITIPTSGRSWPPRWTLVEKRGMKSSKFCVLRRAKNTRLAAWVSTSFGVCYVHHGPKVGN